MIFIISWVIVKSKECDILKVIRYDSTCERPDDRMSAWSQNGSPPTKDNSAINLYQNSLLSISCTILSWYVITNQCDAECRTEQKIEVSQPCAGMTLCYQTMLLSMVGWNMIYNKISPILWLINSNNNTQLKMFHFLTMFTQTLRLRP